jgi:hypothetical protein
VKRRLTVYEVGDPYHGGYRPQIRLQGKWLREAGFRQGDQIQVAVVEGRLIIQKQEEQEEEEEAG